MKQRDKGESYSLVTHSCSLGMITSDRRLSKVWRCEQKRSPFSYLTVPWVCTNNYCGITLQSSKRRILGTPGVKETFGTDMTDVSAGKLLPSLVRFLSLGDSRFLYAITWVHVSLHQMSHTCTCVAVSSDKTAMRTSNTWESHYR